MHIITANSPSFKPIKNQTSGRQAVRIRKDGLTEFGVLDKVMSNNGPSYSSKLFLCVLLKTGVLCTRPPHLVNLKEMAS